MLVKTYGSAVSGIDATTITIESNVDQGINFYLVGLPDSAVKESQQRIEAALKNVGYKIPGKKIVINMAPADIRKEGSSYDLPLAMGILAASNQIKSDGINEIIVEQLSKALKYAGFEIIDLRTLYRCFRLKRLQGNEVRISYVG